jgi:KUP system potassium uptake protein
LFIAMREVWGWGPLASGAIAGAFLCVDVSFFLANLVKVADGGYVPLLLASLWRHVDLASWVDNGRTGS